jgi:hypothetical protein
MICSASSGVRYSKSLLLTERSSSVWASNVADCTKVEVSLETWLQRHESPTQDHGISQAMKRVKEKSGKHIRLKDAMFRSTLALHNPSF